MATLETHRRALDTVDGTAYRLMKGLDEFQQSEAGVCREVNMHTSHRLQPIAAEVVILRWFVAERSSSQSGDCNRKAHPLDGDSTSLAMPLLKTFVLARTALSILL